MGDLIFAITCYLEQEEGPEEFIEDLDTLPWQIPDADEGGGIAFDRATFYEEQHGSTLLRRSKRAIRMIEGMRLSVPPVDSVELMDDTDEEEGDS